MYTVIIKEIWAQNYLIEVESREIERPKLFSEKILFIKRIF